MHHTRGRPRRRGRLALSIGLLAATLGVIQASPALAQYDCLAQNGYQSRFDGFVVAHNAPGSGRSSWYVGASANLSPSYGGICDYQPYGNLPAANGAFNDNSTWVMMATNSPNSMYYGYAQIGFRRVWGTQTYFFTEYKLQGSSTYQRTVFDGSIGWAPLNYGGINRFWVQYVVPADGWAQNHWRLNVDSTIMDFTPWGLNGLGAGDSNPPMPVFSAETHYEGSDMPGYAGSPTRVTNPQLQYTSPDPRGAGGDWTNYFGGVSVAKPTSSRYGWYWANNGYDFNIYTA